MKVNFNFDTGARRIRLRHENPLEEAILNEMSYLCEKGVNMKIYKIGPTESDQFEIEMRINGFDKEKKSE